MKLHKLDEASFAPYIKRMEKSPIKGAEAIRQALKTMPETPGVYRMLDKHGDALYVGKARNLKRRVASYTKENGLSYRIRRMVSQTVSMEIVTTRTEAEALLLEANLIKRLQPRYNILLRDDKSFPFILLTGDHDYPRIVKHRGAQKQKGEYFGPFASAGAVNHTIAILQRAFLLRPCSDSIFEGRSRPCLQYQIKRCSAPCVNRVSREEYGELVEQARAFLTGRSREIQDRLVRKMEAASEAMDYEKAAEYRDRVKALTQIQNEQRIQVPSLSDADVIALYREGEQCCIQVFFFRAGQNFGNRSYFPKATKESENTDILEAFIGQFYQTQLPPKLILLSEPVKEPELIAEALRMRAERKITLSVPERGDRKKAAEIARANARQALERRLAENASQVKLLKQLAERFDLDAPPERIEVYDNSHITGSHAIGAMICAGPDGFIKKGYRKFNIRTAGKDGIRPGDDYAMMREVLTRRFTRLQKEDPQRERERWPELVLVDGGPGHVGVVQSVFEELGISDLPFACIAKGPERNAGRETFYMPGREPFTLPPDDPVMHYLQRLRDEAHRYAIGTHRTKRSNQSLRTELDEVPGIGAKRRRALLHHFGSVKGIMSASVEELATVEGISRKVAEQVHGYFHK